MAPRTDAEARLAAVWAQVLGVERVGVHDNFFDLGGDSILGIRLRSEAQARGLDFSLQELFVHPTVASLAAASRAAAVGVERRPQPFEMLSDEKRAALPRGVVDAYPLSRMQVGMAFHSMYQPGSQVYHDVKTYLVHARLDRPALERALSLLVQRHEMLRTSFEVGGQGEPLQLVWSTAHMPLVEEDWSGLSEPEQQRGLLALADAESRRGFAWDEAPLMRVVVQKRDEASFFCTLSLHHAIMDGWSVASFTTELLRTYTELLAGREPRLEAVPIAYRDFVALEQSAIAAPESAQFWAQRLRGADPGRLPWRARGGETGVRQVPIELSTELSQGLRALARAASVPLKSVLLAAHLKALTVVTGSRDVRCGAPPS